MSWTLKETVLTSINQNILDPIVIAELHLHAFIFKCMLQHNSIALQTISYYLYCSLKTAHCKTDVSKQPINHAELQKEHDLLFLNNYSGDWDTVAAVNEQTWSKKEELVSGIISKSH